MMVDVCQVLTQGLCRGGCHMRRACMGLRRRRTHMLRVFCSKRPLPPPHTHARTSQVCVAACCQLASGWMLRQHSAESYTWHICMPHARQSHACGICAWHTRDSELARQATMHAAARHTVSEISSTSATTEASGAAASTCATSSSHLSQCWQLQQQRQPLQTSYMWFVTQPSTHRAAIAHQRAMHTPARAPAQQRTVPLPPQPSEGSQMPPAGAASQTGRAARCWWCCAPPRLPALPPRRRSPPLAAAAAVARDARRVAPT
jgi:hypothetical protein